MVFAPTARSFPLHFWFSANRRRSTEEPFPALLSVQCPTEAALLPRRASLGVPQARGAGQSVLIPFPRQKSEFSSLALAVSISPSVAAVPRGGGGRVYRHLRILLKEDLQHVTAERLRRREFWPTPRPTPT